MNSSFIRTLILALALATGHANQHPTVDLSIKHAKVGGGLDMKSMNAGARVESKVNENLSVGAEVDNSDSPLKSVFGKFNQRFGNGNAEADLHMNVNDRSISGDITYKEGDNKINARLSSNSEHVVDSVRYTRSGKGWSFKPTFNLKDKNMDLEASADYSDDTNLNIALSHDGSSKLKIKHRLDADTRLTLSGNGPDVNQMTVEVERRLDDSNTLKPKFNMADKHLSFGWVRKIDGGRTMTMNVDPENSVGLELEGNTNEDWKASVNAPWGNFKDADVSLGRKFNF